MDNEDLTAIEEEIKERIEAGAVATVEDNAPSLPTSELHLNDVEAAIVGVKQKIVEKARAKIQDEKSIEKHSENIAKISDRALEVEEEKQRLFVEQVNADNKVVAQEIKNRLIVLKAEAKRLRAEQRQINKDQRAEHKARTKAAKWELYGRKLEKMKYDYVPNPFILSMLLFFDGLVGFFNGVAATSTAIVKALKWLILIAFTVAVLMIVPVTREWILKILKF